LWKVPFKGGSPVRVTKNGDIFANESEDRRFLYYSRSDAEGIWRMPLQGSEEVHVFDHIDGLGWSSWALVQNGIYFVGDFPGRPYDTVILRLRHTR
jgi:hypothetical protein